MSYAFFYFYLCITVVFVAFDHFNHCETVTVITNTHWLRKPTHKAPRKALATRAVKPSNPKASSPKPSKYYPYANPELVAKRLREFAPPSDEEFHDTAVEYCEKRLIKFRKAFYTASCLFIHSEDNWHEAIRYLQKYTQAFESFFEHVSNRYGFERKASSFYRDKVSKAIRKSTEGYRVVHQWTEDQGSTFRPNIKALESAKYQTNATGHR
jgi:hypothetical protein